MKPPPKATKSKAEQENAKRILQFKQQAREYANELPVPDLVREVRAIGKREFRGTRFQQEALIFRFCALYINSVKLVASMAEELEKMKEAANGQEVQEATG